ncbi:MAG: DUF3783 domain-containing protein [Eubacterium sp.]
MSNKIINNTKLIIHNIENQSKEKQLIDLCRRLGYQTRKIKPGDTDSCLGTIVGIRVPDLISKKDKAPDGYKLPELIIFSGISDGELDEFLAEYRNSGIPSVALKAVVTQHNISWSVYELAKELQRERIAMMFGKKYEV